jgi:plasmid stabilization system protein ParE
MRYRVVLTPEAERNLDAIFRFIALDNPAAAWRFMDGLRRRIKTLASFPRRAARAAEDGLDGMELRQMIFGAYRIVFGIDKATVVILQIRHSARLPANDA